MRRNAFAEAEYLPDTTITSSYRATPYFFYMAVTNVSNALNSLSFTLFTPLNAMRLPGILAPPVRLVDISAASPVNTIGKIPLNDALDRCDRSMRNDLSGCNTNLGGPKLTYRDRSKSP